MTDELHAKPVIDGKFWIVEKNDQKIGVLKITEQKKYMFSSKDQITTFDNKKKIIDKFGKDFFIKKSENKELDDNKKSVYGFPTSSIPHNVIFDVKKKLPLFTKSLKSKSIYCAGYYIIKFNKGWVKSFCPKLITIDRYPFQGPFTTEIEMKERLNRAN